jgi:hypothetical protein
MKFVIVGTGASGAIDLQRVANRTPLASERCLDSDRQRAKLLK